MAVSVERIRPDEWQLLRDIRLRSLLDSPDAFGQRYDEAEPGTDEDWVSLNTGADAESGRAYGAFAMERSRPTRRASEKPLENADREPKHDR